MQGGSARVVREHLVRLPLSRPEPEGVEFVISFIWHTWFKGHSMVTNRTITTLFGDHARGWLHRCECGKVWAR